MLKTEMRNEKSINIDKMSTVDMLKLMNEENMNSVLAVERALPIIAVAVDEITQTIQNGGRLIYVGAGTSGRLAVVDASECPPTFGVEPTLVQGIIAGGKDKMFISGEHAEDSYDNGVFDMEDVINSNDIVVGISASGGAKYIVGALDYAKGIGCKTIALTSNENSLIGKSADITVVCDTGAEVVTGSTRLKAGNAQKFVLNMFSTCSMIKTGKVYENMMINLKPSNDKLRRRVIEITKQILNVETEEAVELLKNNNWNIRKAVENSKNK